MAQLFHFKLEKILEYRRQLEDQAKLALAQAQRLHEAQKTLLASLRLELQSCLRELSDQKQFSQAELWLWSTYQNRLNADISQAEAKYDQLKILVESRRQELVTKAMERKLLEKLRAKQAEQHERNAQHKEQNEFDETATLRYGRTPY